MQGPDSSIMVGKEESYLRDMGLILIHLENFIIYNFMFEKFSV